MKFANKHSRSTNLYVADEFKVLVLKRFAAKKNTLRREEQLRSAGRVELNHPEMLQFVGTADEDGQDLNSPCRQKCWQTCPL